MHPSRRKAAVSSRVHCAAAVNGTWEVGVDLEQEKTVTGGDVGPPADGSPAEGAKKPYAPPVLIEWGTLRDITRTVGANGKNDGGVPNYGKKTRF